ncbi:ABC transporter ATP-binding protein [Ligilactobacillus salivarius]|uniref:ABC transporter ATP-binding protein n=1 Tax=Ligilactobacillus salivarius TaxID=1624 RepID=UPI001E39886D|nr:ABC transporter ATP-binding protein [Ligilactobacillus salivarius]UHL92029.1 ABC transporter ATP-binding protein/permease [Ligilactobacillus salivarius]
MQILMAHFKNYKKEVLSAIISIFIVAFVAVWQPRLLQYVLTAIVQDNQAEVRNYGIQLIILALVGIIAGIVNVYSAARVAQGVTSDLREEVYTKIQNFSFGNIEKFSTGSLVVRLINDMNQVTNMIMTIFMQVFRVPLILIGAFILGIITVPRLWWLEVLMVVLIMGITGIIFKKMGSLFDRVQDLMDKINTQAKENLQGVRVVKSFNQEGQEIDKFNQTSDNLNNVNLKIGYLFSTVIPSFELIAYVIIAAVIYLIGGSILDHPSDIAVISSYVTYIMQLLYAIMIGSFVMSIFARGGVSLKRIKEVLETQPDVVFKDDAPVEELDGDVEFDNVTFAYPDADKPILKNISFKVKSGEMVGIVGATGSGKSSLAQLLPRLYDPTEGTVRIGGHDLRDVSEKSLRDTVSYVLQRAILFSGTIASNLRQGKADATNYELERASQIAQAQEFISRYKDTFDHEVEERSSNYSGGQKQRLSIARGVVGKPKILILDDSTSALDAKSEKLVQEALEKELKNTTTFIIAEKIVSVMNADKIIVLDNGRLMAQGTHQELLKNSPIYQEIYATQKAREKAGDIIE